MTGERGKLLEQKGDYAVVRWGEEGGGRTVGVPSDSVTVGDVEAPPLMQLMIAARPHDSGNPDILVPEHWIRVVDLADAHQKVLGFIEDNRVGALNWIGGEVVLEGRPFAAISHDGRMFDRRSIGGEIDADGKHLPQADKSWELASIAGRRRHPHKKAGDPTDSEPTPVRLKEQIQAALVLTILTAVRKGKPFKLHVRAHKQSYRFLITPGAECLWVRLQPSRNQSLPFNASERKMRKDRQGEHNLAEALLAFLPVVWPDVEGGELVQAEEGDR